MLADRPPRQRSGRTHAVAIAQGLFVTFLWSTSWVLIKIGFTDLHMGPLSFAGLRYALAAVILLPLGLRALRSVPASERMDRRLAARVVVYGVLFVSVTQGAQFAALAILPATAVNLVLSATPAAVAAIAVARRIERPSTPQLLGVAVLLGGSALYLGPASIEGDALPGFGFAALCLVAAAISAHLGRSLARDATARLGGPVGLTALSMAAGAVLLVAAGLVLEGVPTVTLTGWLIIGWLAVVNTALAFTIWNHTLRSLSAVESSVVNNTMTIQIAILAVVFLGERLSAAQILGLLMAAAGAATVQVAPLIRRAAARRGAMRVAVPPGVGDGPAGS